MPINSEVFDDIAEMSKLLFSIEEKKRMLEELNEMLTFIDGVKDCQFSACKNFRFMLHEKLITRPDLSEASLDFATIQNNAARFEDGYFEAGCEERRL